MSISDAVILIPGFLGFGQIGHFSYFANRVGAALRGCLLGLSDADIPVIPVKTAPTKPLADRQLTLLHILKEIDRRYRSLRRLHLVGHSTGGVDAYLLTGQSPLQRGTSWEALDPDRVRHKISTVTTIASPHAGTCLALSPLARFFRHPLFEIHKSPSLAIALWQLARSLEVDEMALGALAGALVDTGETAAYALDVFWARTLVDDLQPRHLVKVQNQTNKELKDTQLRCVVTMAGRRTRNYRRRNRKIGLREPDAFFRTMYSYTAGSGFDEAYDDPERITQAINQIEMAISAGKLIGNANSELRRITPELNDGLVNSARQLVNPTSEEELLAVVVGDHIDVMGYYPRWVTAWQGSSAQEQKQLRSGILHSGSGFGDEQFFALFQQIAKSIVSQVQCRGDEK